MTLYKKTDTALAELEAQLGPLQSNIELGSVAGSDAVAAGLDALEPNVRAPRAGTSCRSTRTSPIPPPSSPRQASKLESNANETDPDKKL